MFKINLNKIVCILSIVLLIVTLLPLLNYSNYIHPYTDEYAFSSFPYKAWQENNSIIDVIKESAKQTITNYYTWQGSFSAVFLFGLNPLSISYENYYLIGYFLILFFTASLIFFIFNILSNIFLFDKRKSITVANIISILILLTLPAIGEHFYYYVSGIYYNFFISLAFIAFGILSKHLKSDKKTSIITTILPILLFSIISGGSYPVILISLCLLFFIFIYSIFIKNKKTKLVVALSFIFLLLGLIISAIAPGNIARQELQPQPPMNPLLAIIKSVIYSAYIWLKYFPIIILPILAIIFIVYDKLEYKRYKIKPIFVLIVSFLLNATIFTPTFYALGNPGPLRILNIAYIVYTITIFFNVLYFLIYYKKHSIFDKINKYKKQKLIIYSFFIILSICIITNISNLNAYKALTSIFDGSAKIYSNEKYERHYLLSNADKSKVVTLQPISVKPNLLEYGDITSDTEHWINKSFCDFYGLYKIKLVD